VARHRSRESRRLTTEEMNNFVVQNSSLKQELHRAMMEANEKESMMEELGAELEELRTMRQWEEPNDCYALLRMRPLSIPCAEYSVGISCGKVDYDKSG
jgi:predicted RNase H-like nuclease (RuvC/YqgF family)